MKLIRIIKLARVPYGELDEGDEYEHVLSGRVEKSYARGYLCNSSPVPAYDTTKYPPEYETYTIKGLRQVDFDHIGLHSGDDPTWIACGWEFPESEIKTRYI